MNRNASFAKSWLLLAILFVASSCRRDASCFRLLPLTDTVGAHSESDRSELQWLQMRGGMDSVLSTPEGLERQKAAQGSLEKGVRRYMDSMRTVSGVVSSPAGCVDWRASLVEGRLDRTALVTALMRTLVDTAANAVEWSLADSAKDPARLRVIYAVPGPDGGRLDSAVLLVGVRSVRR